MGNPFTCTSCGNPFTVPQSALDKWPGWIPKLCRQCKNKGPKPIKSNARKTTRKTTRKKSRTAELNLTIEQVLERFDGGPVQGLFTDGSAQPNPGPGGWGAVYVRNNRVVAHKFGHEPDTTNNRMELMALIEGAKLVPKGVSADVYSDSNLCVKTITEWAAGWEKNGWRRKSGEIKNLELVQKVYAIYQSRPELKLHWIQAHDGSRWNEYADSLATAWTREEI
jgi:ribonuclease HI